MANVKFNSFARQIDGQNYCSTVETYADNIIEDNESDAVLIYPKKDGWIKMRSLSYRATTSAMAMLLPSPIYKINRVLIKPWGLKMLFPNMKDSASWEYFENENGEKFVVDVTDRILLDAEWKALPIEGGFIYDTINKATTLPFSQGNDHIEMASTEYKQFGASLGAFPQFLYFIVSAIWSNKEAENYKYYDPYGSQPGPSPLRTMAAQALLPELAGENVPTNWEFQIEYVPIPESIKIKTHKNEPTTRQYTQVVNQRAEVNRASAFGHYLHTTAQKTGTEKIAFAKTYKKIKDVPPIGSLIRHKGERYRLVANSWKVTNPFTFTVTHTLSKNWTSKSKHVAVDQKYRNWSIPFDSYIWRTIYYEEFIELSGGVGIGDNSAFHKTERQNALKALFSVQESNQELRNLFFFKGAQGFNGVTVPASTFGIGNSIVFNARMRDNISAGIKVSNADTEYYEETLYCYEDGTLDDCRIILSTGMDLFNDDMLPASYEDTIAGTGYNRPVPTVNGYVFDEKFHLDKDPGEAIRITIQAHYIPTEDWIVVGNKLAENHPFISGKKKTIKIWLLKDYIRDGSNFLDTAVEGRDWQYWFTTDEELAIVLTVGRSRIKLNDEFFEQGDGNWKAWAITDYNNMLYIGSNDISKREIHFTWKRKRSRK